MTAVAGCCPADKPLTITSDVQLYDSESACGSGWRAQCDGLDAEALDQCEEYCGEYKDCVASLSGASEKPLCVAPLIGQEDTDWKGSCVYQATCECTSSS